MPISWNEIRSNAVGFAHEWADASRERSESQTFWNEFFAVFGLNRRRVASFEEPVKNLSGRFEFIDLLWKGTLIAEHKSRGHDLGRAHLQAIDYIQNLLSEGREEDAPRYVITSDFARIALHDLESDEAPVEFALAELVHHVQAFGFLAGYRTERIVEQDPIDIKAVRIMGELHDALEANGYSGPDLERLLVRVLFCLFAEDSGIFEAAAFQLYLENHTADDGSDLGMHLARMFHVLNTPVDERQENLIAELAELPHVNGELFADRLAFADFNRETRSALLRCCKFQWRYISPAVFGSMFQAILGGPERRQSGAHYTSERDIIKVVRSLFLDALETELDGCGRDRRKLEAFRQKLGKLRFFDPACGCGNFLVIAYRELRRLEIESLKRISTRERQKLIDVKSQLRVDVDQAYGIEIQEWPARIAEVALWLVDHQMNQEASEAFGEYVLRLPLERAPTIVHENALRIDWNDILPADEGLYILGNPPFVGAKFMSAEQKLDCRLVCEGIRSHSLLDYVCCWYFKAANYIAGTSVPVAFVSTNSITQGEQVGVLWNELYSRGMHIHFGHRTFAWESEARGAAHVHVVIIGFGAGDIPHKRIYDYESGQDAAATLISASRISPYLIEGGETAVTNRSRPLCQDAPDIGIGNKPIDDGNFLFTPEEKAVFLRVEPRAERYFRRWMGSKEFLNGIERWCLWLGECSPAELRQIPEARKRVDAVRSFRLRSKSLPTQRLAETPTRFHVENFPDSDYLLIPKVSSERRRYIPMDWVTPETITSDLAFIAREATLYQFGILTSAMHMAWVRTVCGRLKSDFRYSKKLVYNNFPWPSEPTDQQRARVEAAAQVILDERSQYPDSTLADLYDPLSMPKSLMRAHQKLDRAVDRCYRSQPFPHERNRVEYLFNLYEKLNAPLLPRKRARK